jgi:hypothetical protein
LGQRGSRRPRQLGGGEQGENDDDDGDGDDEKAGRLDRGDVASDPGPDTGPQLEPREAEDEDVEDELRGGVGVGEWFHRFRVTHSSEIAAARGPPRGHLLS